MYPRLVGTVTMIVLIWPALLLAQGNEASPVALAISMEHFKNNARAYGLSDPERELIVRSSRRDDLGTTHIRYDQFYNGIKVFESEAISHIDLSGNVTVTNSLRGGLALDTRPAIGQGVAIATVLRAIGARGPHDPPSVSLEILPLGQRSAADLLVWHVRVFIENDVDETAQWDYFVDARNGAVVWSFNSLQTTSTIGTGKTMYDGNVSIATDSASGTYFLRDLTRGGGNYTVDMQDKQMSIFEVQITRSNNIFGNNQRDKSDRATAGADAHYGMMQTWDYFLISHNRNGINGAGRKTRSRVHYGNGYENAFWSDSCFCMTYGDGKTVFFPLVSLDVAGHEMAHGVMSTEANLTYSGESGGLNESSSDIFGTLVEYFVSNSVDLPDYWIGERIYKSNWSGSTFTQTKALRYMDDPPKDGRSPACWSSGIGSLNVHYSSGPNNHMFWLLAEGGTSKCNGNSITGIGRAAAASIWYKAISDYMTSSTNYHAARTACLSAATDLFGASSAEYNAVNAAFAAINVN